MVIGTWTNFTHGKCLIKKPFYRYLFLWIYSIAKHSSYNLTGVICCILTNTSMQTLLCANLIFVVVFGKTCINSQVCKDFKAVTRAIRISCNKFRDLYSNAAFVILLMLIKLSGDIHPNPGPIQVDNRLCISHLNIQSLLSETSPDPCPP